MEAKGLHFQVRVIDMLQVTPWSIRENNSAKILQDFGMMSIL